MALFKTGAIITGIEGKVGGHVFVKTVSKGVIKKLWGRTRKSLKNNRTKNAMSFVSQSWRKLSGSQKATWLTAASTFPAPNRFGDMYTPSGFQLFMQFNLNRMLMGNTVVNTAPAPTTFPSTVHFGINALDPATFTFHVPAWADGSFKMQVDACVGSTGTNRSITGGYKFLGYYGPPISGSIDLFGAYISIFGQIITGTQISVRVRFVEVSSGIAGTWFYFSAIAS